MARNGNIAEDTLFGPKRPQARATDWDRSDRGYSSGRAANTLQSRRRIHGRSRNHASINRNTLVQREPSIHGPSERTNAPFRNWLLPPALATIRRKLQGTDDGDRQMVQILSCVADDGLPAVEAACREALDNGVHSAPVVINILARRRDPAPPPFLLTPAALRLTHEPVADCARLMTASGGQLSMERTQVLDLMSTLKLYGMRGAYDEVMANGIKRQHEPPRIVGDLARNPRSRRSSQRFAIGPRTAGEGSDPSVIN